MIEFKIEHDIDEIRAKLSKVTKDKWPKILAYASTETGKYVRNKLESEMEKILDRPKRYTLKSLFVKYGNTKNPEAIVMWRPGSLSGNSGGRYLVPQTSGGSRNTKGFEKLLQYKGVMPLGYYAIPTKGMPDDGYGNVPGSYYVRMLSFLRAFRDSRQNRNLNKDKAARKKSQFFVVQPNTSNRASLSPGIYERLSMYGGAIRKAFFFSTKAQYKAKFPFYDIATKASIAKFDQKLDEGIKKAIDGDKGF